jgi:hypothetical protein
LTRADLKLMMRASGKTNSEDRRMTTFLKPQQDMRCTRHGSITVLAAYLWVCEVVRRS